MRCGARTKTFIEAFANNQVLRAMINMDEDIIRNKRNSNAV